MADRESTSLVMTEPQDALLCVDDGHGFEEREAKNPVLKKPMAPKASKAKSARAKKRTKTIAQRVILRRRERLEETSSKEQRHCELNFSIEKENEQPPCETGESESSERDADTDTDVDGCIEDRGQDDLETPNRNAVGLNTAHIKTEFKSEIEDDTFDLLDHASKSRNDFLSGKQEFKTEVEDDSFDVFNINASKSRNEVQNVKKEFKSEAEDDTFDIFDNGDNGNKSRNQVHFVKQEFKSETEDDTFSLLDQANKVETACRMDLDCQDEVDLAKPDPNNNADTLQCEIGNEGTQIHWCGGEYCGRINCYYKSTQLRDLRYHKKSFRRCYEENLENDGVGELCGGEFCKRDNCDFKFINNEELHRHRREYINEFKLRMSDLKKTIEASKDPAQWSDLSQFQFSTDAIRCKFPLENSGLQCRYTTVHKACMESHHTRCHSDLLPVKKSPQL